MGPNLYTELHMKTQQHVVLQIQRYHAAPQFALKSDACDVFEPLALSVEKPDRPSVDWNRCRSRPSLQDEPSPGLHHHQRCQRCPPLCNFWLSRARSAKSRWCHVARRPESTNSCGKTSCSNLLADFHVFGDWSFLKLLAEGSRADRLEKCSFHGKHHVSFRMRGQL